MRNRAQKPNNQPDKIHLKTRGWYLVATMPEQSGRFVAVELVEELRRSRPALTFTQIAGEYGESERNFRRYLKGKPMPLAKGRRFARRLRALHSDVVAKLEGVARQHAKGREATTFLAQARHAFDGAYSALRTMLDEIEAAVQRSRRAKVLHRMQLDAEAVSNESERAQDRHECLRSELVRVEDLLGVGLANVK